MFTKSNELENMRKLVAFYFPFQTFRANNNNNNTSLCVTLNGKAFICIRKHMDDDDDDSENFVDFFLPFTDVHRFKLVFWGEREN